MENNLSLNMEEILIDLPKEGILSSSNTESMHIMLLIENTFDGFET